MKERRRAGNNIGMLIKGLGLFMKKILPHNMCLSFLLFVLFPMHIFAKDIVVTKTLLSYTVTLDAVDGEFLLKGTAQKSRVYFTILPEKYVPTRVSVYVDGVSSDLSITKGGSYYVDLEEGLQLAETKQYAVRLVVDNSESNTANVTVFDFAGQLDPVESFNGRSQSQYGLKENVNLNYSILPEGITPEQIGYLRWRKITSGVGTLASADDNGAGVYDAGYLDGTTELCLEIQTGLNSGVFQCYPRTVVAPSGTYMTRADTTVWHVQYKASAGIKLYYWLNPKDVSFSNLKFAEGTCPATNTTGIFVNQTPHDPTITPVSLLSGNSTTGCRIATADAAYEGPLDSWDSGGTFTWNIPTQYVDASGTRYPFGATMQHVATIQPDGHTTVSKGGNTGSAAVNDVSVPWQIP